MLPGLITDRDEYFKQKEIDHQNHVVNFRSSATKTSEALVWTYRTTNCDVISIITTATLVKNGKMKDIRIEPHEVKRLKPPSVKASNKSLLGSSPYDVGLSVDIVKKTKKMNQLLVGEKKEFMAKLNITRFVRSKLENDAATKIQSIYRGYFSRKNFGEVKHYLEISSMIRSNIRSFLDHSGYVTTGLARFTSERQILRKHCATLMQCAFRRFLSRKRLRRLIHDREVAFRNEAAVVLQTRARGIAARARVRTLIEKRRIILYRLSVIKIQAAYRGMIGRRRVHRRRFRLRFLAAKMIQSWYRAKYSRRIANHIKLVLHARKTNRGALKMQGLVRRYLAAGRVARIRLRRLHVQICIWVTRVQCLIRKFLARCNALRRRANRQAKARTEQLRKESEEKATKEAAEAVEAISLLESADIFIQAKHGNTVGVEDIFKGLMGGEPPKATDTDTNGDTILTVSARVGNTDLLRKCIIWGFDINHRNNDGHNAIMIAAENNQLAAFQYLFSFHRPVTLSTEGEDGGGVEATVTDEDLDKPVLVLLSDDIGFLLVTAAANCAISEITMLQALLLHGFDVNTPSASNMTAMHAACEIGHVEAFKLIVKFKARTDVADEFGQTPLHKACSVSHQIVTWILGLDPEFNSYMSDQTRVSSILAVDLDGKDAILHAALAGHSEIVEMLEGIVAAAGVETSSKKNSSHAEEISWSPQDISKGIQLVMHGNLYCLHKLLECGYDADWQDDSGQSLVHAASNHADKEILDLLIEKGADFSLVDNEKRNCFHIIAASKEHAAELMVHLISHPSAAKCKISKGLLLSVDSLGNTFMHVAASDGTEINIDLLAADIFPAILNVHNNEGMSPLLIACKHYHDKLIVGYLKMGADPLLIDNQDRGCLWHIFHPAAEVLASRRPWCSEYLTINPPAGGAYTRKDKDEEVVRLAHETGIISTLMKAGCTLYTDYGRMPEQLMQLPYVSGTPPTSAQDSTSEPGDVVIQEFSMSLMKAIIPSVVSPLDAWRLFISSIRFDDGTLRMVQHLLRMGIIDVIAGDSEMTDEQSIASIASAFSKPPEPLVNHPTRSAKSQSRVSVSPMLAARAQSVTAMDNYQVVRLQDVFFLDLSAVAWIIHLRNSKALLHFVKRGIDVTLPVDAFGNPCLHCVAAVGSADMVDIIVGDKKVRYEQPNEEGFTAGMVAAKHGNIKVAKRLFELRASARKSLEGKYAAWVLAFARKYERNEKNLQTGRYGDDDERYFCTAPDPFYSTWYEG